MGAFAVALVLVAVGVGQDCSSVSAFMKSYRETGNIRDMTDELRRGEWGYVLQRYSAACGQESNNKNRIERLAGQRAHVGVGKLAMHLAQRNYVLAVDDVFGFAEDGSIRSGQEQGADLAGTVGAAAPVILSTKNDVNTVVQLHKAGRAAITAKNVMQGAAVANMVGDAAFVAQEVGEGVGQGAAVVAAVEKAPSGSAAGKPKGKRGGGKSLKAGAKSGGTAAAKIGGAEVGAVASATGKANAGAKAGTGVKVAKTMRKGKQGLKAAKAAKAVKVVGAAKAAEVFKAVETTTLAGWASAKAGMTSVKTAVAAAKGTKALQAATKIGAVAVNAYGFSNLASLAGRMVYVPMRVGLTGLAAYNMGKHLHERNWRAAGQDALDIALGGAGSTELIKDLYSMTKDCVVNSKEKRCVHHMVEGAKKGLAIASRATANAAKRVFQCGTSAAEMSKCYDATVAAGKKVRDAGVSVYKYVSGALKDKGNQKAAADLGRKVLDAGKQGVLALGKAETYRKGWELTKTVGKEIGAIGRDAARDFGTWSSGKVEQGKAWVKNVLWPFNKPAAPTTPRVSPPPPSPQPQPQNPVAVQKGAPSGTVKQPQSQASNGKPQAGGVKQPQPSNSKPQTGNVKQPQSQASNSKPQTGNVKQPQPNNNNKK